MVLQVLVSLSLSFEKGKVMASEVSYQIQKTGLSLQELAQEDISLEQFLKVAGFKSDIDEGQKHQFQSVLQSMDTGEGRERKESREIKYKNKAGGSRAIPGLQKMQQKMLPELVQCLSERFSSFNDKMYQQMVYTEPANWDLSNYHAEVDSIINFAKHLEGKATTTLDQSCLQEEWANFRLMYKQFDNKFKTAKQLWSQIFQYSRDSFPNLCNLASLVLSIGPSNSIVEGGFSHLTSMLSDRRLSLSHQVMEHLLMLKVNQTAFAESEIDQMISTAVECFMLAKRRKMILEDGPQAAKKVKVAETEEPKSDSDSDIESDEDYDDDGGDDDGIEMMEISDDDDLNNSYLE